jgi:2-oxoglutarate dehydrogenase E1 component
MRDEKIRNSFLFGENSIFIEELYAKYLIDSSSVSAEWQVYFKDFHENNIPTLNRTSWSNKTKSVIGVKEEVIEKKNNNISATSQTKKDLTYICLFLLQEYRKNGHLLTNLDPLGLERQFNEKTYNISLEQFNLTSEDLSYVVDMPAPNTLFNGLTIEDMIVKLRSIYCNTTGYEIDYISSNEQKQWLYNKVELQKHINFTKEEQHNLLQDLVELEGFEQFVHNRFPGAKRFSVEGGESAILAMSEIIKFACKTNKVEEYIIGMAHRGRLNVLTKILKKPYISVLSEFQGNVTQSKEISFLGDVKYHLGKSSDITYSDGSKIHLSLMPNPSHLEAVNPVAQGKVRAEQDIIKDNKREKIAGMLIHGDAAFAGQGSVAESLSLGDLEGYKTGGTMHVVINNQVGFTTLSKDARLSRYPTEFAKIIQAPIIHVNGDDVEAVINAAIMAEEFRHIFKKDIVLDIFCYRKYGHNEGDEPFFTQPKMYTKIKTMETVASIYASKLNAHEEYKDKISKFQKILDADYNQAKENTNSKLDWLEGNWSGMNSERNIFKKQKTAVSIENIQKIGAALTSYPDNFNINSKIKRMLEQKKQAFAEEKNIDWGTAESLAYGTLLLDGIDVRLTGQDCKRGTFSHRHAVFFDQETEEEYIALNNIDSNQHKFEVHNSNLSEFAVLGFEYGYSTASPNYLTLWEAQFGDFSNGAQVIIDQFIASAETKWLRMSGLVMLLPHGYEGQGPEHSSARLERYLQLCGENNMQVVNCTTPANFFHVLRRQVIDRTFRKPLIVMSPKSLLRHKMVVSDIKDFTGDTSFQEVIDDINVTKSKVKKIVLCSGKVYYDLLAEKIEQNAEHVAIIRIEQFYPFPHELLKDILAKYNQDVQIIWCQEEPKNMGAWTFLVHLIEDVLIELSFKNNRVIYIGRSVFSSPSEGYAKTHIEEQKNIITKAIK